MCTVKNIEVKLLGSPVSVILAIAHEKTALPSDKLGFPVKMPVFKNHTFIEQHLWDFTVSFEKLAYSVNYKHARMYLLRVYLFTVY